MTTFFFSKCVFWFKINCKSLNNVFLSFRLAPKDDWDSFLNLLWQSEKYFFENFSRQNRHPPPPPSFPPARSARKFFSKEIPNKKILLQIPPLLFQKKTDKGGGGYLEWYPLMCRYAFVFFFSYEFDYVLMGTEKLALSYCNLMGQ